jgi:phosphate transport system substrate-binding protein
MLDRILIVVFVLGISACAGRHPTELTTIRIVGSDTMHILASRWAEEYMRQRPTVSVYSESRGTELGIKAMINGEAEICSASRPLRPEEVRLLAQKYGKLGMGFLVAKDALSVYLHPENPVKDLTLDQLRNIFSGKVRNWRAVGGYDEPILVMIRPPNSGTHLYFREHVLGGAQYSEFAQIVPTTPRMVTAVSETQGAIGYGGIAYGPNLVHSRIDGVAPSEENVRNDSYPIVRYLYLYTVDTPQDEAKGFIDWILKEGQRTVRQVGFVPLWEVP